MTKLKEKNNNKRKKINITLQKISNHQTHVDLKNLFGLWKERERKVNDVAKNVVDRFWNPFFNLHLPVMMYLFGMFSVNHDP